MSTQRSTRHYKCANDCKFEGCPGHEVTVERHNTSDMVTVLIGDGKRVTFDVAGWEAAVACWKDLE